MYTYSTILLKLSKDIDQHTFGKVLLNDPVNVTTDNTVVLPRAILAGTASCGIQNTSQDSTTSIMVGK